MVWKKLAWAACLTPVFSGCNIYYYAAKNILNEPHEAIDNVTRTHELRQEAKDTWKQVRKQFPRKAFTNEFRDGFVEGYSDYLDRGGNGELPIVPPKRYTRNDYMTPEGHELVRDYFLGFKYGREVALASNRRADLVTPLLLPEKNLGPPTFLIQPAPQAPATPDTGISPLPQPQPFQGDPAMPTVPGQPSRPPGMPTLPPGLPMPPGLPTQPPGLPTPPGSPSIPGVPSATNPKPADDKRGAHVVPMIMPPAVGQPRNRPDPTPAPTSKTPPTPTYGGMNSTPGEVPVAIPERPAKPLPPRTEVVTQPKPPVPSAVDEGSKFPSRPSTELTPIDIEKPVEDPERLPRPNPPLPVPGLPEIPLAPRDPHPASPGSDSKFINPAVPVEGPVSRADFQLPEPPKEVRSIPDYIPTPSILDDVPVIPSMRAPASADHPVIWK